MNVMNIRVTLYSWHSGNTILGMIVQLYAIFFFTDYLGLVTMTTLRVAIATTQDNQIKRA
jgi:hypothetical protein